MLWLQSHERYDDLAEYDHTTGIYSLRSVAEMGDSAPQSTQGTFRILSNVFVALYKFGNDLFLRIGNECFPITDELIAEVRGTKVTGQLIARKAKLDRILIVKNAGLEIARLDYIYDLSNQFPNDPTPFIEDEQFDFGLWISNITRDPVRQMVLLGLDE